MHMGSRWDAVFHLVIQVRLPSVSELPGESYLGGLQCFIERLTGYLHFWEKPFSVWVLHGEIPQISLLFLASLNFVPGLPIQCPGWSYIARCHFLVQLNSQVGLPLSSRLSGETVMCLNLQFRCTFTLSFVSLLPLYWPFMIELTLWMNLPLPGACAHPD